MKMSPLRLFVALVTLATSLACASTPPSGRGKTFVLVHGAFQDRRAWGEIVPRLEKAGAQVIAVDLPGRANDGTPLAAATLDAYRDSVLRALDSARGKVILVGHSFGGLTISHVAESAPERIATLVFVSAYLPQVDEPDQSLAKLSATDTDSKFNKVRQNFLVSADYQAASVLADDQILLFCERCSEGAKAQTLAILQREPLAPAAMPVTVTAERFGRVDKVYIATSADNAVSYSFQKAMIARTPVRKVVTLASGHSPFLEVPDALATALLTLE